MLLDATVDLARDLGLIGPTAAIDSTGMETRHVSVHYARANTRQKGHYRHRFPKLSAIGDTGSHVVTGAVVDRGPGPDAIEFPVLVRQAHHRHAFDTLLGDAGYESEKGHRLCREELGVESIFPTRPRGRPARNGGPRTVRGKYRIQLQRHFPQRAYRQRRQIETVFSMIKRNLGSALRSRRPFALNREVLLRVITHNLMILLLRRVQLMSFQQSPGGTDCASHMSRITPAAHSAFRIPHSAFLPLYP